MMNAVINDALTESLTLHVEVCVDPSSPHSLHEVESQVKSYLKQEMVEYVAGAVQLPKSDPEMNQTNCVRNFIGTWCKSIVIVPFSALKENRLKCSDFVVPAKYVRDFQVHAFILHEEDAVNVEMNIYENGSGDDEPTTACEMTCLPHASLQGVWESIILEEETIKNNLLQYASTAMLFASRGVSTKLISWNRLILLHGPPGTGKTTLCRTLAHKLSIRLSHSFSDCLLLEINSHSLFSKWFSESGKLVHKLFSHIEDLCGDPKTLVCVLMDEIESLVAARKTSLKNGEPSDAVRTVNAILTALDRLGRRYPNVLFLTTTNMTLSDSGSSTSALDEAFIDRVDIKQFIGLPPQQARYEILRSCLLELIRAGVIIASQAQNISSQNVLTHHSDIILFSYLQLLNTDANQFDHEALNWSRKLEDCAAEASGFSGRSLRKLPFQTHAHFVLDEGTQINLDLFLKFLKAEILRERQARIDMNS